MPRLAAQREDYLLKALRDYKAGQRPGYDATMDEVIRPITDADIVDLVALSGAAALKQKPRDARVIVERQLRGIEPSATLHRWLRRADAPV